MNPPTPTVRTTDDPIYEAAVANQLEGGGFGICSTCYIAHNVLEPVDFCSGHSQADYDICLMCDEPLDDHRRCPTCDA